MVTLLDVISKSQISNWLAWTTYFSFPLLICLNSFTNNQLYQPSMAYLKKRSLILKTVVLEESWVRRKLTLLIRSSTTLFTSSEKTATSRGRIMSCLSTLLILSQSSPSLGNRRNDEALPCLARRIEEKVLFLKSRILLVIFAKRLMPNGEDEGFPEFTGANVALYTDTKVWKGLTPRWGQWNGPSCLCTPSRTPC